MNTIKRAMIQLILEISIFIAHTQSAYTLHNVPVSMYENSVQASRKVAPKMSDLTAKDISPQGISMDVNLPDRSLDGQPISSAKSISAPWG